MADLNDSQAAQSVKIIGSSTAGVESTPVNSTTNGGLHVNLRNDSGTEIATSSNPLRVDPTGTTTQPISAASLPLPSGASTAANQATEISHLSDLANTTSVENSAVPTRAIAMGADDGTNLRHLQGRISTPVSDDYGLVTRNIERRIATYSASVSGLNAANNATDIFTITGSASKVVKVRKIILTATQTTSSKRVVNFIKRSTANSGGTSTNETEIAFDSNSSAATATVLSYTANPTLGTTVGTVATIIGSFGTATPGNAQSIPNDIILMTWGIGESEPVTLRGTSQVFAVNLNGVSWTGESINICMEWTEE